MGSNHTKSSTTVTHSGFNQKIWKIGELHFYGDMLVLETDIGLAYLTEKRRKQMSFHMFCSCVPSASCGFDDEQCKCMGVGDGDLNIAYPTNGTQFMNISLSACIFTFTTFHTF